MNPYIEADLTADSLVYYVITQSHASMEFFVTAYTITLRRNDETETNIPRVFTGNTAVGTTVSNALPDGSVARYVRLLPEPLATPRALRWELIGCYAQSKQL